MLSSGKTLSGLHDVIHAKNEALIKIYRMEEEVFNENKSSFLHSFSSVHIHGSVFLFYFPKSLKQQKECSSLLQGV